MPKNAAIHASLRLLLAMVAPLAASGQQSAADPILPQGEFYLQLDGRSQGINEVFSGSSGDRTPLGSGLFIPEIGSTQLPALLPSEARFRALSGSPSAPGLRLGGTTGRISAEEQAAILRLSYGLLDRVTVGATLPFVRRRVDSLLRLVPTGSNVGVTPGQTSPTEVSAFLGGTASAVELLRSSVGASCADLGPSHPDCLEGEALLEEAEGFLGALSAAYSQESIFPLVGSSLGALITGRWTVIRTAMAEWDAAAPESVPLAATPLDDAAFRALYANAAWPEGGFPLENSPSYLLLGDVELHAAVALLRPGTGRTALGVPTGNRGIRIRSALTATVRFPTGAADSLRAVAPMDPPAGVGGVDVGLQTDFLFNRRLALLTNVEAGWNGSRETLLLAPDPSRLFDAGGTSTRVRWEPGNRLRVRVTPRLHIGSALSLGVGWEFSRADADHFTPLESGGPDLPASDEPRTLHRGALELRYTAMHGEIAEAVRFPFEVFLRASRVLSGSGEGAPVERRLDAGVRFLIRR